MPLIHSREQADIRIGIGTLETITAGGFHRDGTRAGVLSY